MEDTTFWLAFGCFTSKMLVYLLEVASIHPHINYYEMNAINILEHAKILIMYNSSLWYVCAREFKYFLGILPSMNFIKINVVCIDFKGFLII